MKLEILILAVQNACRRQTTKVKGDFSLSMFRLLLSGWENIRLMWKDSLTHSQILFIVNKPRRSVFSDLA